MKKIIILITLMISSFVFSQDLLLGFENSESGGVLSNPFGGMASPVLEVGNGTNTSQVLKIVGNTSADVWQGVDFKLTDFVELTTTKSMTIDVFSDSPITFLVKVIGGSGPEAAAAVTHTGGSVWQTLSFTFNIALDGKAATANGVYRNFVLHAYWKLGENNFSGVTSEPRTFYIDNIKGKRYVLPAPTLVAAPIPPVRNPRDVISIYSGAYNNIASNLDAGWCGDGSISEIMISGNATEAYLGNSCQGIDFLDSKIDASLFTFLHIDFYTTETNLNGKVFNLKLVNFGSGFREENSLQVNINSESIPAITSNGWVSVDVPVNLSGFTGLAQAVIVSNLNNSVWYDNFYLYKPINARNVTLNGTSVPSGQQILNTTDGINYTKESVTFVNAGTGHFNEIASNLNLSGPYGDWSSADFSNGMGISGGDDIAIQPGTYNVSLNISTGIYTFEPITVSVIGDFNSSASDVEMTTTDNITYTLSNYTFSAVGGLKFRDNNNWNFNYGAASATVSSTGTGVFNSGTKINYTVGTFDISFNRTTLQYNFKEHKAYDDQISLLEGATATSLITNATSVLANDTFASNSTAVLVSAPTNGTLLFNSDGTFSYTHNNSKMLSDSFTYKDYNGESYSNIAKVTINVTEVNINPPTDISLSNVTINENLNNISIGNLSATDLDSNNVLTYSLVAGVGDTGNSNFAIVSGNQLQNIVPFDFETQLSYSIRVKVNDGGGHTFEKVLTIGVDNVNDIAIVATPFNSYCSGNISINSVTNTSGVVKYSWAASNGGVVPTIEQNTASITNLSNGTYTITITDDYYSYFESFNLLTLPQYQNTSVCYVTSDDTNVANNRIFINNQGNYNISSYEILKETSLNNYTSIGTMLPTDNSFLDINSKNTSKAYKYEVRSIDNCGNVSVSSLPHKTIWLSSGVAIDNSVNLIWSNYQGLTYGVYNIYRSTNSGNFVYLDYVSSDTNGYNDNSANVSTNNYQYYVAIDVSPCSTSAAGKIANTSSIKSNIQKLGNSLSINANALSSEIILFPNPSSSKVILKIPETLQFSELEIYNTLGQKIKSIKEKEFSVEFLSSGTYLIKIVTNQGTVVKNFIKE